MRLRARKIRASYVAAVRLAVVAFIGMNLVRLSFRTSPLSGNRRKGVDQAREAGGLANVRSCQLKGELNGSLADPALALVESVLVKALFVALTEEEATLTRVDRWRRRG